MVGRARAITQGKCRCSKRRRAHNCFEPFRHPGKFNELIGHLRYLGHMDKMEVDKEAWGALQHAYDGYKIKKLSLLGHSVCQRAFKSLLRLGSGRVRRLVESVRNADESCPMDMRYCSKKFSPAMDSPKRQLVHDFLHHICQTLAEPMPEGTGASKRPRSVRKRDDKLMMRRTNLIEKALPPGSFYEYLAMLRRQHPHETFSYKLFCNEYNRFIAPKLTATAVIAHGHDMFLGLSLSGVASDSSRTVDLLARTLERFREPVLKQGAQCLHTPFDYIRVLQEYLLRDDVRPNEGDSEVVLVDQVRDWSLEV
ncbi:unnamed protein product [Durusdinium trenchii]|uniref:Uncharacterized protein n=1 Tax=Durusdinium trenchii TaxID=1381693 RepID=A0ABP0MQY3_9DINO